MSERRGERRRESNDLAGAHPTSSRRRRQRPRPGARRSRYLHRLVVPAALRQPVGVRAAARPRERRHLGVPAGRRLARHQPPTCATPTCCAPRSKPATACSSSSTLRRGCFMASRSTRRSSCAGCCGRCRARRACTCTSIRGPTTRAPRSKLSRPAPDSKWSAGPRASISPPTCRRRTCRTAPRSASIARPSSRSAPASRRRCARRLRGRERARADHSRLARVGEDHGAAVVCGGLGAALGAVPEAARLQRHRRHHRRDHHEPARGARLRPHLGLPVLLAARCRVRRRGAAPAQSPVGRRSVRAVPARDGRQRPAAADLRHHRQARPARRDRPDPPRL